MKNEQPPRRMVGLKIFTIVIAVIMAGSTTWFEMEKYSHRKVRNQIQNTYRSLSQNATAMEDTKHQRVEYFKNRFLADFPSRYSYGAADFMRRLNLIDARGIVLDKLEISPHGQDLAFNLIIGVNAPGSSAQGIFSRYYQALKDFEGMVEINFSSMKPDTGNIKKFKIIGAIELE
ncbi:MAG TPA: hypothetical protein VK469_11300 [Candidatus Kapabacteria bacterium]|nr:hypothetical protein [Candidatus Kapabacteria bacterium]